MIKRVFDIFFSVLGLFLTGWLVVVFFVILSISIRQNGMYTQIRIGRHGRKFKIYKLRTISNSPSEGYEIPPLGRFLRKSKIDELPQLYNILINDMSFVGPRPDIPGYYDRLEGADRILLELKPGITGAASIKYANEEEILSTKEEPEQYNDEVIFPDKVRINLNYQQRWSLFLDFKIVVYTILRKKLKEKCFN